MAKMFLEIDKVIIINQLKKEYFNQKIKIKFLHFINEKYNIIQF